MKKKLKKVKEEVTPLGAYDMVHTTWEVSEEGDKKVRVKKPVAIELDRK